MRVDIVLLCGGKGTRFREVSGDKSPKSLYKVKGVELIQHTLDLLIGADIGRQILAVDYQSEQIISWAEKNIDNQHYQVSYQKEPGIPGAVKAAANYIRTEYFILCNTDEIRLNFSAAKFLEESQQYLNGRCAVMATAYCDNIYRHRKILTDASGKITRTELKVEKYKETPQKRAIVNTGFLLIPKSYIFELEENANNDWSSIIDPLVSQARLYSVVNSNVEYYNVGTREEYEEAARITSEA
ncbi:NTP transferase domain-containing protein [Candidatus Saccharibacteria bacterium]|nr:NTP transferase domain-containing protein [Candidatus Saccharibacteria bacterium]